MDATSRAMLRSARSVLVLSARRGALVALLIALAPASQAHADWFVTPFIGAKFAGATNFVDLEQGAGNTKLTLGASAGFVGDGLFGVEADFGYSPRFFERSGGTLVARSHVLTLMGNVIVAVPRSVTGYSLRPFVSGGAGLMSVGIDTLAGIFDVDSNLVAINVGGGATGDLSARTSIRFDLRYLKSVTSQGDASVGFGSSNLSFWRAAVGIALR